ncbi:MAG: TlpA family protein disulfide reductase [Actinobacteria bacterium]|nr:TlpA family protein disulfide reductase [Actinomycetota bacterium]MCB8998157.1 TlpA family protein disulfide reductase [Actinomycetota bacterium]MCB9415251.1 TlpA family protein disulfide reductase [Actinomycetota bacterium]
MRRRSLLLGAVLVLTLAAGCSQETGDVGQTDGFVAGDGSSVILPVDQRQPAPVLTGTDLNGDAVDTATWQGSPGVINVWASWCAPCRAEAPELVAVAKQNPDVNFLGLDTRDSEAPARAFVEKFGIPYPNLPDPDGQLVLKFSGSLPPQAIPSTLLIDSQGRVAGRFLGAVGAGELDEALQQLSDEDEAAP